jgi:hypothetical protein
MTAEHIWRVENRRTGRRFVADFYAIELSGGARYLRRVKNFSDEGLLLENPLADAFPGQHVELELPRQGQLPLRVEGEIVYVTAEGRVGIRVTSPLPVDSLGGRIPL